MFFDKIFKQVKISDMIHDDLSGACLVFCSFSLFQRFDDLKKFSTGMYETAQVHDTFSASELIVACLAVCLDISAVVGIDATNRVGTSLDLGGSYRKTTEGLCRSPPLKIHM